VQYLPQVLFLVIIGSFAIAIISGIARIVNYYRASRRFTPSAQPRQRIEQLIATANDDANSTLYESRQLIETDALPLSWAMRKAFTSGLRQQSITGRIRYTRRILQDYYLPVAVVAAA
jgi:hypothetical protein